jgi:hypothetical protein
MVRPSAMRCVVVLLRTLGVRIAWIDRTAPGGNMRNNATIRNSPVQFTVAGLGLLTAALVLIGACQSYEDSSDAVTEENTAPAAATVGNADTSDVDIAHVDVADEALLTATVHCEVRCRNGANPTFATNNCGQCRNVAFSRCPPKRIKCNGRYIYP